MKTVQVCALEADLRIWPQGDATIVGERGVALSGGQKARVGLARAVYREAEVYLLDDPLSAVDAAVGRHIHGECILGELARRRGAAVILATHQVRYLTMWVKLELRSQVQYLSEADQVLVLESGAVAAKGSYDQLAKTGTDFSEFAQKEAEERQAKTNPQK